MKKTIIAITAAAVLGTATFTPTPASAWIFFLVPALLANKDPNFKAVNPYAVKKMKRHHRHRHHRHR